MAFPALAGCIQGVGAKRRTVRADSGPLIELPTGARSQVMPQADLLPDNPEPPPWLSYPEVNLQSANTAATFNATGVTRRPRSAS